MRTLLALWSVATAVAALGAWLLFGAAPGLNWALFGLAAAGTLLACVRLGAGVLPRSIAVAVVLAGLLAAGAAVTAAPWLHVLIALAVCGLLAAATALAGDPRPARLDAGTIAALAAHVGAGVVVEFVNRLGDTLVLCSSSRWRPHVRGLALATPIVGVFALVLAGADPLMAAARTELGRLLASWDALPRALFFGVLLAAAAGACGLALRGPVEAPVPLPGSTRAGLGAVERTIILGWVALLFGAFLVLQVSYLFGNVAAAIGSGVTFAEHARRGFAELTVVATLCVLLIAALDHRVDRSARGWAGRLVDVALLVELGLLLLSALRRLLLYQGAYGFTTARLYGQIYMIWLAVVLAALAVELRSRMDGHRLARRAAVAGLLALAGLTYWNHEAWIVRRNLARFAVTGQLDPHYLACELSANAVPALLAAADRLPDTQAAQARTALARRYRGRRIDDGRWYEWNLGRHRAARAMDRAAATMPTTSCGTCFSGRS